MCLNLFASFCTSGSVVFGNWHCKPTVILVSNLCVCVQYSVYFYWILNTTCNLHNLLYHVRGSCFMWQFHLSLRTVTSQHVWAGGWVSHDNTLNKPIKVTTNRCQIKWWSCSIKISLTDRKRNHSRDVCFLCDSILAIDLYSSPNIVGVIKSRRMRWAGHVARMGEERGVYRVLVGKPDGNRPLGRPMRRWVDNIRMDLQEVGCGYVDWIGLAQDRDRWRTLVSAVMNLRVP